MSESNLFALIQSAQRSVERLAAERGFDSVEAMVAANDAEEFARRSAEIEAEARKHRTAVVAALAGRIRPEIADAIVAGTGLSDTNALRAVRAWLASPKPVVILSGGPGLGKSVAAAWALAAREGTFQALKAVRLGSAWERWTSDREDGVEALRLAVSTMLLDDLGQEPMDDRRVTPAIEELFDARQTPALRTIITTNLTRDQIRARYSDRVLSRLAQNAAVIDCSGPDLRRANR